jgi:hypothetical protein
MTTRLPFIKLNNGVELPALGRERCDGRRVVARDRSRACRELTSPLSRGLFHKAISESGGARDGVLTGRPIAMSGVGSELVGLTLVHQAPAIAIGTFTVIAAA